MRGVAVVVAILTCAACENVLGPSDYPYVAGFYVGTATITRHDDGYFISARAELEVTQLDETVDATWAFYWDDGTVDHMPTQRGVITRNGSVAWPAGIEDSADPHPECGFIRTLSITLTFSDRTARYEEHTTTDHCGDYSTEATADRR